MIKEGQCTLSENSYSHSFLCSALFCSGDSLEVCRFILRDDLMVTKPRGNLQPLAFLIAFWKAKGGGGVGGRGGGGCLGRGDSQGGRDAALRGRCGLRTLVGTAEAAARRSGRKGDSCCPAAACSFFVNVTREDVGFLYFSMI